MKSIPPEQAFDRDIFLLRQKHLAIKEKYYVWSETGDVLLYVERPSHMFRNILALFGGFTVGLVVWVVVFLGGFIGNELVLEIASKEASADASDTVMAVWAVIGLVIAGICGVTAAYGFSRKRHLTFYRDDTKAEPLLHITPDKKFTPIVATYTVSTPDGEALATLRHPHLKGLLRRRWLCLDRTGDNLCEAWEDSAWKAFLRRVLGPLFGLLRTNFVIRSTDGIQLGSFDRLLTVLDRYVLDMTPDQHRTIDRRVALALGVMLDTGERR